MNVLFLGAGKRLSLLESFLRAAAAEGVDLKLFAIEGTKLAPIAGVAEIVVGPSFASPEFAEHLEAVVVQNAIDMIIPNMDAATVALASMKERLDRRGCSTIVSEKSLCGSMYDKAMASDWFSAREIVQPPREGYPCIAKSRYGYGARDQSICDTPAELSAFLSRAERDRYFVQAFVQGQEYTVDAYVDSSGAITAMLSRKRLQVSDGEVDVSETHRNEAVLGASARVLSYPGWLGPITLQFIDAAGGPFVIEVNPRFGGGVTHAIHCGLDMPAWLLRERLGRELPAAPDWPNGSVMTRCRRDIFHDPQH